MADFSVFIDHAEIPEAAAFYETFQREGALQVRLPVHRLSSDFLALLQAIQHAGNRLVLLVSHGNPKGLIMPLTRRRRGRRPALADSVALVQLIKFAMVQQALRELRSLQTVDQQRPEDWFGVLNLVTRPVSGYSYDATLHRFAQHPATWLFQNFQQDTPEVQRLRTQLNDGRQQLAQRRAEAESRRAHDPVAAQEEFARLQREAAQFEENARSMAQRTVENWLRTQVRDLGLIGSEVDQLLHAMHQVQRLQLTRVLIRGCNIGQSEESMTVLCNFLGARILDAPQVTTLFGPVRPHVGPHFVQRREGRRARDMCGADELRRRSGCWWSFEAGRFRLQIKYLGPARYYGVAVADSWETVERWAQDRFGLPQSRLSATFPAHFLFTAPPAFPLEPSFRQHMSRVLGFEA